MKKNRSFISTGDFSYVSDNKRKLHASTNAWWMKKSVQLILILAFSALDASTLYIVFEYIFSSSPIVLWATTFGTALALNFLPCISARFFLEAKYGEQERDYTMFYVTLGLFGVLFIALAALRISTADAVIGSIAGFVNSSSGTVIHEDETTPGTIPMVILQCTTNLITSAIAFALSYLSENFARNRLNAQELQIADYEEQLIALACQEAELNNYDFDEMLAHENNKRALAHAALDARGDVLRIEADEQLEQLLASPDADTHITDEQKAEDKSSAGQSPADNTTITDAPKTTGTNTKEVA